MGDRGAHLNPEAHRPWALLGPIQVGDKGREWTERLRACIARSDQAVQISSAGLTRGHFAEIPVEDLILLSVAAAYVVDYCEDRLARQEAGHARAGSHLV